MKTKTIKRFLACFIALLLAVAILVQPLDGVSKATSATNDDAVWDGSVAQGFAGGRGTEDDPYLISNGAELAYLASIANGANDYHLGYFELTCDIYLNDTSDWESWDTENRPANVWIPIGVTLDYVEYIIDNFFIGSFNGCGHTIYGMYCYNEYSMLPIIREWGLFGCIGQSSISNLNIACSAIIVENNPYAMAGGIAAALTDSSIANCISDCKVTGVERVGGIAGSSSNSEIINCTNTGSILGVKSVGGIEGLSSQSNIVCCKNKGDVCTDEAYEFSDRIGGIVGECYSGLVDKCINIGRIAGDTSGGGIIGTCDNGAEDSALTVSRCLNTGMVSGIVSGGIVGYDGDTDLRIENCYNIGSISATSQAGGLVGVSLANSDFSAVRFCYNVGVVESSDGSAHSLIGGVFINAPLIEYCYYLEGCCLEGDANGDALADEQLCDGASYIGFDFENVWTMAGDPNYPYAELIEVQNDLPHLPGDADNNGAVTVADALLILRAAMGLVEFTHEQLMLCDMDGNGTIGVADAILVLRMTMGV